MNKAEQLLLRRLHFWSEQVALSHEHSIFVDGWNRIRFAIAVGQFQSAQAALDYRAG